MLSQFLHLSSLNEIVDVSRIYAPELSRIRFISPASLNTFSNANRSRSAEVMQAFFRAVYWFFRNEEPDFVRGSHHGRLSRFKLSGIYAIDSTTIQLAFWCIDWAKHRQRKSAVKMHMVANAANWLPHSCVFGKAKDHATKNGRRALQLPEGGRHRDSGQGVQLLQGPLQAVENPNYYIDEIPRIAHGITN